MVNGASNEMYTRDNNTCNFLVNVKMIILCLSIWSKVWQSKIPITTTHPYSNSTLIHWFLELGRNPPRDQTTFQDEYLIAFPSESLVIGIVHQIVSPISNPESMNIFTEYLL